MKPARHGNFASVAIGSWLPSALLGACILVSSLSGPVRAQGVPVIPDDSHVRLDAPGLLQKKARPGLPDVKAQPQAWPRLDRGAVICRSESDMARLAARRRGEAVDGPVDCQIVRGPTAIAILQRKGAGMTQVRTTDPSAGGTGWTDAWLPEKAPAH